MRRKDSNNNRGVRQDSYAIAVRRVPEFNFIVIISGGEHRPSGEKATSSMFVSIGSMVISVAPLAASRIWIWSSWPPEATRLPSGENATNPTPPFSSSEVQSSLPVTMSHMTTSSGVPLQPTMRSAWGENLWNTGEARILSERAPLPPAKRGDDRRRPASSRWRRWRFAEALRYRMSTFELSAIDGVSLVIIRDSMFTIIFVQIRNGSGRIGEEIPWIKLSAAP